eukprot:6249894-Prymnesium_polylepis.1
MAAMRANLLATFAPNSPPHRSRNTSPGCAGRGSGRAHNSSSMRASAAAAAARSAKARQACCSVIAAASISSRASSRPQKN